MKAIKNKIKQAIIKRRVLMFNESDSLEHKLEEITKKMIYRKDIYLDVSDSHILDLVSKVYKADPQYPSEKLHIIKIKGEIIGCDIVNQKNKATKKPEDLDLIPIYDIQKSKPDVSVIMSSKDPYFEKRLNYLEGEEISYKIWFEEYHMPF